MAVVSRHFFHANFSCCDGERCVFIIDLRFECARSIIFFMSGAVKTSLLEVHDPPIDGFIRHEVWKSKKWRTFLGFCIF